jgi:predicted protein tyrosine phosphatase
MRVLFVCSQNKSRSPTAERVFSSWPGIEVSSAGVNRDAENPITPELVEWADRIFVMEKAHQKKLCRRYRAYLKGRKVICLNIPDEFPFMDPDLVFLLKHRIPKYLPTHKE